MARPSIDVLMDRIIREAREIRDAMPDDEELIDEGLKVIARAVEEAYKIEAGLGL